MEGWGTLRRDFTAWNDKSREIRDFWRFEKQGKTSSRRISGDLNFSMRCENLAFLHSFTSPK